MDESWKYFEIPLPGIRDGIRLSIIVRDRLTFPLFVFHGGGKGRLCFLGKPPPPSPHGKGPWTAQMESRGAVFFLPDVIRSLLHATAFNSRPLTSSKFSAKAIPVNGSRAPLLTMAEPLSFFSPFRPAPFAPPFGHRY